MTEEISDPHISERFKEKADRAVEELITGDSDDPPISEEAVAEMLRMTHLPAEGG